MELKKQDIDFKDIIELCSRAMLKNIKMESVNKGSDLHDLHEQWKKMISLHTFMWLNIPPKDRAESAFQILCDKSPCENADTIHISRSNTVTIPCILKLVRAILKELENASISLWEFAEMVIYANIFYS